MYWRFYCIVYEDNRVDLKWSYLTPKKQKRRTESAESEFTVEMVKETKETTLILLRQGVKLERIMGSEVKDKTDFLGIIYADVPFPPETSHVRLLRGEIQLFRIQVIGEIPSVQLASKKVTPKGVQEISWSAQVEKKHPLWFSVFIELDGARYPLEAKIRESKVKISFNELPGCKRGRIIVQASTGFHTGDAATDYFSLPLKPPRAVITYPSDGDELQFGQPLQLRGQGFDIQNQKHLRGEALEWSIDGVTVGKGRIPVVPSLELGKHSIILRVTDESGLTTEMKIEVKVTHRQRPIQAKSDVKSEL